MECLTGLWQVGYSVVYICILWASLFYTMAQKNIEPYTINEVHDGKEHFNIYHRTPTNIKRLSCILIGCIFYGMVA